MAFASEQARTESWLSTEWILSVFERLGPVGVGLLTAVENILPPLPSEVILPLAGFSARTGAMHVGLVWIAATVGACVGALVLYGLGAWLGYQRLHRLAGRRWFVLVSQPDLDRGSAIFDRHGSWIVAASRCVPVLRSVVSIPAGMAGMPLVKFSVLTAIGSGVWNAVFIGAGWALAEQWQRIEAYGTPVGVATTVIVVLGAALLVVRKVRSERG